MKKPLLLALQLFLLTSCQQDVDSNDALLLEISSYSCAFPDGYEYVKPEHGVFYNRSSSAGIQTLDINPGDYPDQVPDGKVKRLGSGEISGIQYTSKEYILGEFDPMVYHIADFDGTFVSMTGDFESFIKFLEGCKK